MFKTLTNLASDVRDALSIVVRDTEFPLTLEVVTGEGESRIIPMGDSYAITVNESTTEDDIFDLEPSLERLSATVNEVYAEA